MWPSGRKWPRGGASEPPGTRARTHTHTHHTHRARVHTHAWAPLPGSKLARMSRTRNGTVVRIVASELVMSPGTCGAGSSVPSQTVMHAVQSPRHTVPGASSDTNETCRSYTDSGGIRTAKCGPLSEGRRCLRHPPTAAQERGTSGERKRDGLSAAKVARMPVREEGRGGAGLANIAHQIEVFVVRDGAERAPVARLVCTLGLHSGRLGGLHSVCTLGGSADCTGTSAYRRSSAASASPSQACDATAVALLSASVPPRSHAAGRVS